MAMGLAVTWCDTPRRLMGRAALHQQGPNEVRHRFSPRDHDNVKVPQRAICETTVAGHHLLSWWRVRASQASNLRTTLGWLRQIRHQYHQSTFCWPWGRHPRPLPGHVVWPHAHRTTQLGGGRHRRRPCRTQCTGTCFYYYRSGGSHAPEHRACFTGRAFDWWWGGKLQKGCGGIWFTGLLTAL